MITLVVSFRYRIMRHLTVKGFVGRAMRRVLFENVRYMVARSSGVEMTTCISVGSETSISRSLLFLSPTNSLYWLHAALILVRCDSLLITKTSFASSIGTITIASRTFPIDMALRRAFGSCSFLSSLIRAALRRS